MSIDTAKYTIFRDDFFEKEQNRGETLAKYVNIVHNDSYNRTETGS